MKHQEEKTQLPEWINKVKSLAEYLGDKNLSGGAYLGNLYSLVGFSSQKEGQHDNNTSQVLLLIKEIQDLMTIVHDLRQDSPTIYTVEQNVYPGDSDDAFLLRKETKGYALLGVYQSKTDALRFMEQLAETLNDKSAPRIIYCYAWEGGERRIPVIAHSYHATPIWNPGHPPIS